MNIISPISDQIVNLPQGTPSLELKATVQADSKPAARLHLDLGWPFYSGNVRQVPWESVVTDNGDGTFTAKETIYAPYAWSLPSVDKVKRWFVFDGNLAFGKTQIRTI